MDGAEPLKIVRSNIIPRSNRPCPTCGTVVPSPRGDRSFRLSDFMIVIMAIALVCAGVRPLFSRNQGSPPPVWIVFLVCLVIVCYAMTPTLLLLRLRKPRPNLKHLTRNPGFVATLAGSSIIVLAVLSGLAVAMVRAIRFSSPGSFGPKPIDPYFDLVYSIGWEFAVAIGPAVMAVWLLLAISGRRRPSRNWFDTLGRIVGSSWIIFFVVIMITKLARMTN